MPSRPANAISKSSPPKPTISTWRLATAIAVLRRGEKGCAGCDIRHHYGICLIVYAGNSIVNSLEFTGLIWAIAAAAGFLGALTGLGGGVVLTPALTLLFGIDIRYAIGASLMSVIAT